METAAEKRIRLRRMRILENSEDRLKRIISGNNHSVSENNCDNEEILNPASNESSDHHNQLHKTTVQFSNKLKQISKTNDVSPKTAPLPPRDEPFPLKVSQISSPIHYKTLQLSQYHSSILNRQNIINNLRCNSSAKLMLLLVMFAFIGSFYGLNLPICFISFQSIKYSLHRNPRLVLGNIFKELVVCIFSYVIMQVVLKVII